MKEEFVKPSIVVTLFNAEDIITKSPECGGGIHEVEEDPL